MVKDGAFSHKIGFVTMFKEILNHEGHPNYITGSKVMAILLNGWICLLVELHWKGSAPATCAAGLFLLWNKLIIMDTSVTHINLFEIQNILVIGEQSCTSSAFKFPNN